jgi:hypothetical protein
LAEEAAELTSSDWLEPWTANYKRQHILSPIKTLLLENQMPAYWLRTLHTKTIDNFIVVVSKFHQQGRIVGSLGSSSSRYCFATVELMASRAFHGPIPNNDVQSPESHAESDNRGVLELILNSVQRQEASLTRFQEGLAALNIEVQRLQSQTLADEQVLEGLAERIQALKEQAVLQNNHNQNTAWATAGSSASSSNAASYGSPTLKT